MTNNKSTKRALFASAMALLLCFSMLLGTTYAWFTDSVTSVGNKIVAGTLDVDLYIWNSAAESVEITEDSAPIFGEGAVAQDKNSATLWEPGKTQVAYLSIKNNGNLDLKYQVAIEAYGETNGLLDVLSYSIANDAKYGDDEEEEVIDNNGSKGTTPGGNSYDNGSLKRSQIEAIQRAIGGIDGDGMYGPVTREAAGGLSPEEAYKKFVGDKKPEDPEKAMYAGWSGGDWEKYFARIRQSGVAAAEAELARFTKAGYIPSNMVAMASIGARGGGFGH